MDIEYCGTYPRKFIVLGQLDAISTLLKNAAFLNRQALADGRQVDVLGYLKGAQEILASVTDRASHCDLQDALTEADAALGEMVKMASVSGYDPGVMDKALRLSIKIIIKIGKVVITIEF